MAHYSEESFSGYTCPFLRWLNLEVHIDEKMKRVKNAWNIQNFGQLDVNKEVVHNAVQKYNTDLQLLESGFKPKSFAFSVDAPHLTTNIMQSERRKIPEAFGKKGVKNLLYANPVTNYFKEYCQHSTLHGLRYLGEKNMSTFERFCWLLFLALSLVACVYLIRQTWIKWETSPVLVTFSGNTMSISEVPFPAVTICSEHKINNSMFNLTKVYELLKRFSDEQIQDILKQPEFWNVRRLSLICSSIASFGEEEIGEDTITFLAEVGESCLQLAPQCEWRATKYPLCLSLIFPILTEEGYCCTFNMLSPKDMFTNTTRIYNLDTYVPWTRVQNWTLEDGYDKSIPYSDRFKIYPRRSFGTGLQSGLTIDVQSNTVVMDKICNAPNMGFKMLLHNPAEMPSMSGKFLKLPENRQMIVAVKPSMFMTMDNLRRYTPEKRGCFFPEERKLRYFKIYTQDNCEFECTVNITRAHCGCVAFYMPHEENTTFCGPGKVECVLKVAAVARSRRLFQDIHNISDWSEEDKKDLTTINKCGVCLPACTEVQYDVQTSQSAIDMETLSKLGVEGWSVSSVSVFFKELQFIPKHRSELYGWTDFLANCGGIMGFCLGFSVLSLIEIIYFLTIRLACKIGLKSSSTKILPT